MRLKRFGHAMTGTAGYEDGENVSQADGEQVFEKKKKKKVSGIANWMLWKALIGQDLTREASSWMLEVESDPRP